MVLATQCQDHETIEEVGVQENGTIRNNQKSRDEQL